MAWQLCLLIWACSHPFVLPLQVHASSNYVNHVGPEATSAFQSACQGVSKAKQ